MRPRAQRLLDRPGTERAQGRRPDRARDLVGLQADLVAEEADRGGADAPTEFRKGGLSLSIGFNFSFEFPFVVDSSRGVVPYSL